MMDGTVAADDEYMTMDADTWSDPADMYENNYTPDCDLKGKEGSWGCKSGPDSREQKKEEMKKEKAATNTHSPTTAHPPIPLCDRYITIKHPPANAKQRKRISTLDVLRLTTLGLVLLCILLLGGLLILSFNYVRLCEEQIELAKSLTEEKQKLKDKIGNLRNHTRTVYCVSSIQDFDCSGSDLLILNPDEHFHNLGIKVFLNGTCNISFS
ncbi:uncharacterized protein LOC121946160 [Plectropomus leopardus]|uniref:uncharacterized protein LOC121946160 n=1 Tax=Plectropomus leopardus TaxID=160734 RepID=UPI001C4AD3AF|nr:uncharacterized protein LOC121946160 [Plectropomus leopardus]